MPEVEPYKHDCEDCAWVNWIVIDGKRLGNMYFCKNSISEMGSVVIRFSDEPSDYWSSPIGMATKGSAKIHYKLGEPTMKNEHANELLRVCKRLIETHYPEIEEVMRAQITTAIDKAEGGPLHATN